MKLRVIHGRKTWTDSDGTPWPITGTWCQRCGKPLTPVDGHTTHPTCDPTLLKD